MATPSGAQTKLKQMLSTVGRTALSTLFPRDFEVYLCMLELSTTDGQVIDSITFPVNPESIRKTENKRTTVRNSAGGIVVLTSPIFVPQDISIKGDFGRGFKILLNSDSNDGSTGLAFSIKAGKYTLLEVGKKKQPSLKSPEFDVGIKTGFGCIKILQSIVSKSNGVDNEGKPFRLFFYNLALGESYLVVIPPTGLEISQNMSKNMIWEYNLNMTAIAPLEAVKNATKGSSAVKNFSVSVVQKTVNDLANYVATVL